ncbi:NADH-cytochrome b5 reductase 1 [Frankliniella fusca]|uniref:NADH-cytochrome b5 reductase 1 n=1 Tax=Frankliniella fusca TaxID=407009 RepID=A0AAE1GQP0_9NEOP|nr:NADH-cytochrome b5 reductase 1 [Frankliniella fusca]
MNCIFIDFRKQCLRSAMMVSVVSELCFLLFCSKPSHPASLAEGAEEIFQQHEIFERLWCLILMRLC